MSERSFRSICETCFAHPEGGLRLPVAALHLLSRHGIRERQVHDIKRMGVEQGAFARFERYV